MRIEEMKKQTKQQNWQHIARNDHEKTTSYRILPDYQDSYKFSIGKGNEKRVLVSYTTLNHASKSRKVATTAVGCGHTRIISGHLMSRNNKKKQKYPGCHKDTTGKRL